MVDLSVADWKWNVWKVNSKTGKREKWMGMISDPKTGFEWLKKQGHKAKDFRINNVPPTINHRYPEQEVYATEDLKRHQGEDLTEVKAKAMSEQTRTRRTIARQVEAQTTRKPVTVASQKPKAKDSKEMKKIKADAESLLRQHMADEQAEIDAAQHD